VAIARAASLLGRIAGLHRIPFETPIPMEDTSASYSWPAQNAPKPISKLAFSNTIKLGPTKAAGIVGVSAELIKLSVAGMEGALRDTLVGGLTAFTDRAFLDPASAAIADTKPASVTNGTTPIASTGNLATDVATLLAALFSARPNADGAVLIPAAGKAAALRGMNPGFGLPILVSEAALGNVIALDPAGVFVADAGVAIDVSREASIQMNDAPDNPATAATVPTSLWQMNLAGFKVERFVNWQAVPNAVKYLAT
jgi:HK97 family phage major capsid protein